MSRAAEAMTAGGGDVDGDLFPISFLRLLAYVPACVRRLDGGVVGGRVARRGDGGRYLFRGHRDYRPGDDLRRVDWRVEARHGNLVVRQFDAERDHLTEVWLDGSASMGPCGGRVATAQAAALACAIGLSSGGRARLGVLRGGEAQPLLEADAWGSMPQVLARLSGDIPDGRADLAASLPRLVHRVPRGARLLLVSDLLTRADPGVLQPLAGRGIRGAVLHLRVPEVTSPAAGRALEVRDAESGGRRRVRLTARTAAKVAERARAHGARWAHHIRMVGLVYRPFAPGTSVERLLRQLVAEVP